MNSTDDSIRETREATNATARAMAGMIRRMKLTLTSAPFWRAVGHLLINGIPETRDPEAFLGIGFYSRPAPGANAEAIVVFPAGAASNPVIVAARDEDARKKHAELAQDETAMFNRGATVVVKADNTIEARSAGGVAAELLTKADGVTLKDAIANAATVANDGGAAFKAAILAALVGWPAGTTVLKGE